MQAPIRLNRLSLSWSLAITIVLLSPFSSGPYGTQLVRSTASAESPDDFPPFRDERLKRAENGRVYARINNSWIEIFPGKTGQGRFFSTGGRPVPAPIRDSLTRYYCRTDVLPQYQGARLINALAFLSFVDPISAGCLPPVREALSRIGTSNITRYPRLGVLSQRARGDSEKEDKDGGAKKDEKKKDKGLGSPCTIAFDSASAEERRRAIAWVTTLRDPGTIQACLDLLAAGIISGKSEKRDSSSAPPSDPQPARHQARFEELTMFLAVFEALGGDEGKLKGPALEGLAKIRAEHTRLKAELDLHKSEKKTDGASPEPERSRADRLKGIRPDTLRLHDAVHDDRARFLLSQKLAPLGLLPAWKEVRPSIAPETKDARYFKDLPLDEVEQKVLGKIGPEFLKGVKNLIDVATDPAEERGRQVELIYDGKTSGVGSMSRMFGVTDEEIRSVVTRKDWFERLHTNAEAYQKRLEEAERSADPFFGVKFRQMTQHFHEGRGPDNRARLYEDFAHDGKLYRREIPMATPTSIPTHRMTNQTRREIFGSFITQAAEKVEVLGTHADYFRRELKHFRAEGEIEPIRALSASLASGKAALAGDPEKAKAYSDAVDRFYATLPQGGVTIREGGSHPPIRDEVVRLSHRGRERSFRVVRSASGEALEFVIGADDRRIYERRGSEVADVPELTKDGPQNSARLRRLIDFLKHPRAGARLDSEQMNHFMTAVALPLIRSQNRISDEDALLALGTALAARHRDTIHKELSRMGSSAATAKQWFRNTLFREGRNRKTLETLARRLSAQQKRRLDAHVTDVVLGASPPEKDGCQRVCDQWSRHLAWSGGAPDAFATYAKYDYDFAIAALQGAAAAATYHFCPEIVGPVLERIGGKLEQYRSTWLRGEPGKGNRDGRNPYRTYGLRFAMILADAFRASPALNRDFGGKRLGWLANLSRPAMERAAASHVADQGRIYWSGGSALHFYASALVANGLSETTLRSTKTNYTGPDDRKKSGDLFQYLIDKWRTTVDTCRRQGVLNPELCAPYDTSRGHTKTSGGVRDARGGAARLVPFAILRWNQDPSSPEATDHLLAVTENFLNHSGTLLIHGNGDQVHFGSNALAPYYFVPGLFQLPEAVARLAGEARSAEARKKARELLDRVSRLVDASYLPNGNFISPTGQFGNSTQWANPMGILATAPLVESCNGRPVTPVYSAIPDRTVIKGGAFPGDPSSGPEAHER